MDRETIEILLSSNLNTIKSFVTTMFDSMKADISQLRAENNDLKHSLEYAQSEIDTLKVKCASLEVQLTTISDSTEAMPAINNRVRVIEDWSKRKNLRISGMGELSNENKEQTTHSVQKLIADKLGVTGVSVCSAFRINRPSQGNEPRQIIAKLSSEDDKIKVLKSGSKLKNSPIFLNDDVSSTTMAIRRTKLDQLKQKRREGFIADFRGAELVVRTRPNRNFQDTPHHGNSGGNISDVSASMSAVQEESTVVPTTEQASGSISVPTTELPTASGSARVPTKQSTARGSVREPTKVQTTVPSAAQIVGTQLKANTRGSKKK